MQPIDHDLDALTPLVPHGSRMARIAEHQPEYETLPAVVTPDGSVISRWTFTEEERARIAAGEDMYVAMLVGLRAAGGPLRPVTPISLTVGHADWRAL